MNEQNDTPTAPPPNETTLVGPIADAFDAFRVAARELEATADAHKQAQERFRLALGRFTQLAATAPDV